VPSSCSHSNIHSKAAAEPYALKTPTSLKEAEGRPAQGGKAEKMSVK